MDTSMIQVMHSQAGYYLGIGYREDFMPEGIYPLPYSRESGYFETREEAEAALQIFFLDNW